MSKPLESLISAYTSLDSVILELPGLHIDLILENKYVNVQRDKIYIDEKGKTLMYTRKHASGPDTDSTVYIFPRVSSDVRRALLAYDDSSFVVDGTTAIATNIIPFTVKRLNEAEIELTNHQHLVKNLFGIDDYEHIHSDKTVTIWNNKVCRSINGDIISSDSETIDALFAELSSKEIHITGWDYILRNNRIVKVIDRRVEVVDGQLKIHMTFNRKPTLPVTIGCTFNEHVSLTNPLNREETRIADGLIDTLRIIDGDAQRVGHHTYKIEGDDTKYVVSIESPSSSLIDYFKSLPLECYVVSDIHKDVTHVYLNLDH